MKVIFNYERSLEKSQFKKSWEKRSKAYKTSI